jgi:hypothetical protein
VRGVVLPLALAALLGSASAHADPCVEAASPEISPPPRKHCQTVTLYAGTLEVRRIEVWPGDVPRDFEGSVLDAAKLRAEAIDERRYNKHTLVGVGVVVMALGGAAIGGCVSGLAQREPKGTLDLTSVGVTLLGMSVAVFGGGAALTITGFALPSEPGPASTRTSLVVGLASNRLEVAF